MAKENFDSVLFRAVSRCEGDYLISKFDKFEEIYPFTTENIAGYIDFFNLEFKSLLTVGSSLDQVINASLCNCKEQSVLDYCPFTKYYFYLKKASLMSLDFFEYLDFFLYKDYPVFCKNNKKVFSLETYDKIKPFLRLLDYESFLFWDEILLNNKNNLVRERLFSSDEERDIVIRKSNLYLRDRETYNLAKKSIRDINPSFITGDIFELEVDGVFDNIFLSNVAQYYDLDEYSNLVKRLFFYLSDDGKMLISYLYDTRKDTEYKKSWPSIFDLNRVYDLMGEYITSFESIVGVRGILFEKDDYCRDAVLLCDKTKVKSIGSK